jgi:hypothetical protein
MIVLALPANLLTTLAILGRKASRGQR